MAMRMTYESNENSKLLTSPAFLIGTIEVYVIIDLDSLEYIITEEDTDVPLHYGRGNSLRMCKLNAKSKLKELGCIFNTEKRNTDD